MTIPPYKLCLKTSRIRLSQWLESMRKDVECVIGILKKHWAILDKGVEASKLENADLVFKTCCALHNMLLDIDGYDKMWEGSITSDPQLGNHACFAIQRLNDPLAHDNSGHTVILEEEQHGLHPCTYSDANIDCPVRKLTMEEFRD